jgi:hypothetical protein
VKGIFTGALEKIRLHAEALTGTRRLFVLLFLGIFVLLLAGSLLTVVLLTRQGSGPASPEGGDVSDTFRPRPIPPEEFFLPGEPDFLPEVLLERERRESWTAEDARPFWTDPLDGLEDAGRERYIERMGAEIDEMMERVP